jgi:hypothetical protein
MGGANRMNEEFPLWSVPAEQQRELLIVASVLCVISLAYALYLARRERDPYPLFVFIGAAFAILLEPVGDIFTQVVYPHIDQVSLFTAWGRKLPLWMGPNYAFFFCVPVLLVMHYVLKPGLTVRKWWITYFLIVVGVTAFEQPGIAASSWKYYGQNGPLAINSYPVWVGFNNAQCLLSTAVAIHLFRQIGIRGKQSVLLIFLVPLVIAATHIAASLPVATATRSSENRMLIEAAALLTIFLNCLMVWVGWKAYRWSSASNQ